MMSYLETYTGWGHWAVLASSLPWFQGGNPSFGGCVMLAQVGLYILHVQHKAPSVLDTFVCSFQMILFSRFEADSFCDTQPCQAQVPDLSFLDVKSWPHHALMSHLLYDTTEKLLIVPSTI